MTDVSRRDFLAAGLAAAPLLPLIEGGQPTARRATRIRTVTAGVTLKGLDDRAPVEDALRAAGTAPA